MEKIYTIIIFLTIIIVSTSFITVSSGEESMMDSSRLDSWKTLLSSISQRIIDRSESFKSNVLSSRPQEYQSVLTPIISALPSAKLQLNVLCLLDSYRVFAFPYLQGRTWDLPLGFQRPQPVPYQFVLITHSRRRGMCGHKGCQAHDGSLSSLPRLPLHNDRNPCRQCINQIGYLFLV